MHYTSMEADPGQLTGTRASSTRVGQMATQFWLLGDATVAARRILRHWR